MAIHSIATHILPDDDEHMFTFIKNSFYNTKEVNIGAARYLNKDRATRRTQQATSVVLSINPNDVSILLPAVFLFSKRLQVEKATQANHYTQFINCYRFRHAFAQCTEMHTTFPSGALNNTCSAHRCQYPTCSKCGDAKAVSGCCPTSPPTACTAVTTTIPSPGNAGLDQSPLLDPRAHHLLTKNYPTPPPTVSKPWMWVMIAAQHPLLPKPLQPRPSTFPPPDPSKNLGTPRPPQRVPARIHWTGTTTGNALHTLAFVLEMIKNHRATSRQGLAPVTNFTLVQHNSLGSWNMFPSLFSSIAEGPSANSVLLQYPLSSKGFLPSFLGFTSFAPPVVRPRVACYVSLNFLQKFAVLPFFSPKTNDFMALDVFTTQGCFGTHFPHFTIGNTYARPLPPSPHSVSPKTSLLDLEHPYLVPGDFNIHNAATNPSRLLTLKQER